DLLLIVLDVSDPAAELHYETVMKTLDELLDEVAIDWAREDSEPGEWQEGATTEARRNAADMPRPRRVLLLNKVDRLADNRSLLVWQRREPDAIPIVAREAAGLGHEEVTSLVREAAQGGVGEVTLRLSTKDSKAVNLVENRAEVLER